MNELDWKKVDEAAIKEFAERDTERLLNVYSLKLLAKKSRTELNKARSDPKTQRLLELFKK